MGIAMRKVQSIAKQSQERVSDSSVPHSPMLGCKSSGISRLALGERKKWPWHSSRDSIAFRSHSGRYICIGGTDRGSRERNTLSEIIHKITTWLSSRLSVLPVRN